MRKNLDTVQKFHTHGQKYTKELLLLTNLFKANEDGIKKSVVVTVLGLLFILAPIGNIALSVKSQGLTNWYSPLVWIQFIPLLSTFSIVWLGLIFTSGVLILLQHKIAWALSIVSSFIVFALNIYNIINETQSRFYDLGFLLSSAGIIILLFYFRYPYLDRRESLLSKNSRSKTHIPAQLEMASLSTVGYISNISRSGFLFETDHELKSFASSSAGKIHIQGETFSFNLIRSDQRSVAGQFETKLSKNTLKDIVNIKHK